MKREIKKTSYNRRKIKRGLKALKRQIEKVQWVESELFKFETTISNNKKLFEIAKRHKLIHFRKLYLKEEMTFFNQNWNPKGFSVWIGTGEKKKSYKIEL